MKKILPLFFVFAIIFSAPNAFSQLSEVNFNSKVTQSAAVIEGKVVSQSSFWDVGQKNIYTVNRIEVYKVFKGNLTASFIELITPGGTIGLHKETVEPSLSLSVNEVGVFMLKNNTVSGKVSTTPQFEPYASVQGYVKYDLNANEAVGHFDHFHNIKNTLYPAIQNVTNATYTVVAPFSTTTVKGQTTNKATPTITNFTPTTVTAGTATTITINGTNFGATAGTVGFSNADDGGATFVTGLATEIISWNDNQIVVEVYQDAGTGPIQVTNADPATVTSATNLTVSYAQLNAEHDPGSGTESYQTRHVDRDGSGGYIWQMHTDFDASAANAPFLRSLDTWRCNTSINWTIGTVTTTDVVANDNINIVRFDNGSELPNGVLGRCTSRWSGCGGATIEWYVEELDIVFDDGTNWNFTTAAPAFSEFDFESVSLHELGHGHQLGHVISPGAVMHFSIANGTQNRVLGTNDQAGGADVHTRSTGGSVCAQPVMTDFALGATGAITGSNAEMENATGVPYSISAVTNADSYTWTVPTGASVASGQGTTSITVDFGTTSGDVTVTPVGPCGNGTASNLTVTLSAAGTAPVADFSGAPTTICAGETVTFTDLSTNTPTSWNWNFGDGSASTDQNPTHTYTASGNYTVTLTATNIVGSDDEVKTNFVTVNNCVPNTELNATACGIGTFSSITQEIRAIPVAGATSYEFLLTEQGTLNSFSATRPNFRFKLGQNSGWKYNTAYDIQVRVTVGGVLGEYSTSCTITTPAVPTPEISPVFCNTTLTSISDEVRAIPILGATQYEFQLVPQGGGTTINLVSPTNFRFRLSQTTGFEYNTTYDVSVRAFVDGAFTAFGPSCPITSPSTPVTEINPVFCNTTLASISTEIRAIPIAGATQYEFQLVPQGGGSTINFVSPTNFRLKFSQFTGWTSNTTYDVSVRAFVNGAFTAFGTSCPITSPGSTMSREINDIADNGSFPNDLYTDFDMSIYPNPNQGQSVYLELQGLTPNAQSYVTDLSGRTILYKSLNNDSQNINAILEFNDKLSPGFYFISVISGSKKITKKLIVQ